MLLTEYWVPDGTLFIQVQIGTRNSVLTRRTGNNHPVDYASLLPKTRFSLSPKGSVFRGESLDSQEEIERLLFNGFLKPNTNAFTLRSAYSELNRSENPTELGDLIREQTSGRESPLISASKKRDVADIYIKTHQCITTHTAGVPRSNAVACSHGNDQRSRGFSHSSRIRQEGLR
jgi:hypothetical protein